MPQIDLIISHDCPNVNAARQALRRALEECGDGTTWREWQTADPAAPAYARGYGSPTILVDGVDVSGVAAEASADCCRVYHDDGISGVPPVRAIVAALNASRSLPT